MRVLALWMGLCAGLWLAGQSAPPKARQKASAARSKPAAQPPSDEAIAERWMRSLTLRQRVAQLFVIRTHGNVGNPRGREWRDIVRWVRNTQVGGIIVVNRVRRGAVVKAEPFETAEFINRLQKLAKLPLLVGGDFERSVSMRFDGTIQFPHAMAYGAAGRPEWTAELGGITAREARTLGFQWVFAPTADVNNNPDNPIIGIRSFGVDAATVSTHVQAFVEGSRRAPRPALVTVKHFPGHGDTAMDSHAGMPVIASDRARLQALELRPFAAAIAGGVDSVMSAHIALPNVDPSGVPSTISPVVIGEVLRKEMGFAGLVTTDAMDMAGLAREYGSAEASVRALEAGVDVLLMPRDPDQAVAAVMTALQTKRLTASRINDSVRKVLRAKVRLGLHKGRLANTDRIPDVTEDEASVAHAQKVADAAVAVLRGDRARLPVANGAGTCVLALAERRGNGQGTQLAEEVRTRAPEARTVILDPQMPESALAVPPDGCQTTVVAAFLGFGGSGKLNAAYTPLLGHLMESGRPVVLAAVGNPFLVREYPQASLTLTTYSTVPVSETALAKVLFGEMPAAGRPFVSFGGQPLGAP
jgi:beta-N-acetylhexosaminidase